MTTEASRVSVLARRFAPPMRTILMPPPEAPEQPPPSGSNPWYHAPDYVDPWELWDDEIEIRLIRLSLQIPILEESAQHQSDSWDKFQMLDAASSYREERDRLFENAGERADHPNAREKEVSARELRDKSKFVAQAPKHEQESRPAPRAPKSSWDGIERRQKRVKDSTKAKTVRGSGTSLRTIHISVHY